eukprot:TRINITY_DN84280_c0_g1_i1.p1 TRINITY_DN84280_c0_g1~~TRINITY_DN84280_c0_g1_i1.p1  ORF type:complete len:321 (-),score=31.22 TRINITY_DN84280_c0_g1_i1:146-1108(-)
MPIRTPKPRAKRDAIDRMDAADGKIDGKYFGRKIHTPGGGAGGARNRSRSEPANFLVQKTPTKQTLHNNEQWEEEYRLLKDQLMELDRQEQDVGRRCEERERRYQEELEAIDDRCFSELEMAQDRERKDSMALRARSISAQGKDRDDARVGALTKVTAESKMWELREQDLQEQFAYRERELHRLYAEHIQQLQEELEYANVHSRVTAAVERDHLKPRGGARLGVEIAEWRAPLPSTGELLKTHLGVKVVSSTGPADAAGIRPSDIINKISISTPIQTRLDFKHAMDKVQPGETVLVHVERDGAQQVVPVVTDVETVAVGF